MLKSEYCRGAGYVKFDPRDAFLADTAQGCGLKQLAPIGTCTVFPHHRSFVGLPKEVRAFLAIANS